MAYTLHSVTVGLKVLASWWNEIIFAVGNMDSRVLVLEALTPVESASATTGTQATTSYAASSSGALTAAITAPQSGKVWVTVQAEQWAATAVGLRTSAAISVSAGSGAAAASDDKSIRSMGIASGTQANNSVRASCTWLITGLTPGATVTATMQHRMETAVTGNFLNRRISLAPVTGY